MGANRLLDNTYEVIKTLSKRDEGTLIHRDCVRMARKLKREYPLFNDLNNSSNESIKKFNEMLDWYKLNSTK